MRVTVEIANRNSPTLWPSKTGRKRSAKNTGRHRRRQRGVLDRSICVSGAIHVGTDPVPAASRAFAHLEQRHGASRSGRNGNAVSRLLRYIPASMFGSEASRCAIAFSR